MHKVCPAEVDGVQVWARFDKGLEEGVGVSVVSCDGEFGEVRGLFGEGDDEPVRIVVAEF